MCDGEIISTLILTLISAIVGGSLLGSLIGPLVFDAQQAKKLANAKKAFDADFLRKRRQVHTAAYMRAGYDWWPLPGTRVVVSTLDNCFSIARSDEVDTPDGYRVHVVTRNLGPMVLLRPLVPDEPATA